MHEHETYVDMDGKNMKHTVKNLCEELGFSYVDMDDKNDKQKEVLRQLVITNPERKLVLVTNDPLYIYLAIRICDMSQSDILLSSTPPSLHAISASRDTIVMFVRDDFLHLNGKMSEAKIKRFILGNNISDPCAICLADSEVAQCCFQCDCNLCLACWNNLEHKLCPLCRTDLVPKVSDQTIIIQPV
jgi:hypothetical protein